MKSLNRVFLMGYLGQSPEIQISKSGKPYSRLSVATHRTWINKEDEKEDKTDWHSVFVWGPLAERCCNNLRKGALVFVEGSLTYWQVATQENYKNAIQGHEVRFLNPAKAMDSAAKAPQAFIEDGENVDNSPPPRNHNAVAHPA